jgi:hypothetical protein
MNNEKTHMTMMSIYDILKEKSTSHINKKKMHKIKIMSESDKMTSEQDIMRKAHHKKCTRYIDEFT